MSAVLLQDVHRPCPTANMQEVPCDNPFVLSLLKGVVQHGQAVIAYLQGTVLTVCCAVTRVVLLVYDLASLPCQWLSHCWGFACDWAVGSVRGGAFGTSNLLVNDGRSRKGSDLRALKQGAHFEGEQTAQTALPSSPASARQLLRSLSGGTTSCSITFRVVQGHELNMAAPSITVSGVPSPSVEKTNLLEVRDRSGPDVINMQAAEEGLDVAAEAEGPSQAAPASPSHKQQQQQCSTMAESSTRGVISRVTTAGQEEEETQKVTIPSTTSASEMVPRSFAPEVSKHPVDNAVEGSTCSDRNRTQERMLFQLDQGEEEEASSFVPLSITGTRTGRPTKWSLGYLGENAEEEGGTIVGGGSFAKVAMVTHKGSGAKMAVKAISRHTAADDSLDEFINMELKTLQAAGAHPNVVDFLGFIRTTSKVYVMMPFVATDLEEVMAKVGALGEDLAKKCMQQVVSAVEYLHSKRILHRDLKPANMLLTEGETLLLADFGIATIMPSGQTFFSDLSCGTKSYMSPEQVTGEEEVDFSLKVDMWGLGVVAYELMHCRTPFRPISGANGIAGDDAKGSTIGGPVRAQGIELQYDDDVDVQERDNISSAALTFDEQLVSAEGIDFISKLLEREVEKRLSARDAAEHTWLGGLKKATEIRSKAADAVAAREVEMGAEKARLVGGRRRVARRRVPAAGVGTEGAVGAVAGGAGDGNSGKRQA